jgi:hypothetical protein
MIPEEMNRAMDFIIQSQARLAVAQEQDQEWSKQLFGQMAADRVRMLELIEHHSEQIDRFDRFALETREFHKDALARLDRILDRLTDQSARR